MANELITVGYKGLEVQVKGAVIKDRISSALGKPAVPRSAEAQFCYNLARQIVPPFKGEEQTKGN